MITKKNCLSCNGMISTDEQGVEWWPINLAAQPTLEDEVSNHIFCRAMCSIMKLKDLQVDARVTYM